MDNSFQLWLADYGVGRLAKKLGVTPYCVNRWRRRDNWPTVQFVVEIAKASRGALTMENIIRSIDPSQKVKLPRGGQTR